MGFNISAPHMYAECLDKLNIEPGNAVLDVGSGCGHLTCVRKWNEMVQYFPMCC
jgi:protein-L-isoaspartate O-methyltransferase